MFVKETVYYDLVGVPTDASPGDLQKAFRKAAMKYHPDRGGDVDKFNELSHAYNILKVPETRQIYNQYGDAKDFAKRNMFKVCRGLRSEMKNRGADVFQLLDVSLEDLYNGTSIKHSFTQRVICYICNGIGTKSGETMMKCSGCEGHGKRYTVLQLSPTEFERTEYPCPDCNSLGEIVDVKDLCLLCKGQKVVQENKELVVTVEKGMRNGQRIAFRGEADQAPGILPGDLVFVLVQKEHRKFKRNGDNLSVNINLNLFEALCGFGCLPVTHLDGREIFIYSQPNQMYKPGPFKSIIGEGMPLYAEPSMKGDLLITFTVELPIYVSPRVHAMLEPLFPEKPSRSLLSDLDLEKCERKTLRRLSPEEMTRVRQRYEEVVEGCVKLDFNSVGSISEIEEDVNPF